MNYKHGDIVTLKVDVEKTPFIVTGILNRVDHKLYEITSNENILFKQELELELAAENKKITGFNREKK